MRDAVRLCQTSDKSEKTQKGLIFSEICSECAHFAAVAGAKPQSHKHYVVWHQRHRFQKLATLQRCLLGRKPVSTSRQAELTPSFRMTLSCLSGMFQPTRMRTDVNFRILKFQMIYTKPTLDTMATESFSRVGQSRHPKIRCPNKAKPNESTNEVVPLSRRQVWVTWR